MTHSASLAHPAMTIMPRRLVSSSKFLRSGFTVGSRLVFVCGRDFARAWKKAPREIAATVIHEMLHSLGLGENPPTPREITYRVEKACWQ